ncbi:MAG TPA: deaminase [Candidatus Saccharimonadales bacterium]|nr:deaminase [Candidatus Saccharimonadales bacterium]
MKSGLNTGMGTPATERLSVVNITETLETNTGITDLLLPGEFEAVHYYPDKTFEATTAYVSDTELAAMGLAVANSGDALVSGNPPVGAVLVVPDPQKPGQFREIGGGANDKTEKDINSGHAEIRAWEDAKAAGYVDDKLDKSVVVETVPPCSSCAPRLAEARIMKVVIAATRREGWDASGGHTMRQRDLNMHGLFIDGYTDTIVVRVPGREAVLAKYAMWATQHGYKNAPDISKIPQLPLLEDLMLSEDEAVALRTHVPDKDSRPNR